MKFNKEHLVDIKSLTEVEAKIFLEFLRYERRRHLVAATKCKAWVALFDSEAIRQTQEIEHIDKGVAEVYKKFGWEGK